MANRLRLTMFFDDGITGWSESHYDLTSQSLSDAVLRFTTIMLPKRRNLLAAGPWLKYLRASYDDTFRDSQVFFTAQPPTNQFGEYINNPAWAGREAAVEWTAALLRGVGGDLYRKQIYVSGIPYFDTADIGTPQQDPDLMQAFGTYKNGLVQNNYGFPVWERDLLNHPYKTVTNVVLGVAGYTFTIPGHGFSTNTVGTRVWLSGMQFLFPNPPSPLPRPNGAYTYKVVDADTITVFSFRFPTGGTFVTGQAQGQVKVVVPYQNLLIERFTHRKRGRPFDAPRGRQKRRTLSGPVVK